MTKVYSLALLSFAFFLYSCKSASKAYQKGDYTDAIELGVKRLQKNPNDIETRDLIQRSYNLTVEEHEDQVRLLSNSKNDTRYEQIYNEYMTLQHLYRTIRQYPEVARQIRVKDYSEYLATYGDKAAETHIERADRFMGDGTKLAFREAFREFNTALRYRPDDYELRRRRDTAYDRALTKVIIADMQQYGDYRYTSSAQLKNFQRDILRTLSNNMNNDFVRFYTEWEARNRDVQPDQVLELNLNRISIGQPYDQKNTREVSKEVVVKEIVYKPDSVVKQYGTVRAKITSTKRTLISQGDLVISVRDMKGRSVWNDRFTGEHKWQTEFSSYTGDERALSETDKTQVNKNPSTPPSEDHIMEELLRQIQSDLTSHLRSYYARR